MCIKIKNINDIYKCDISFINSISAFIILYIFIDLILRLVLDRRIYNSISTNLTQKGMYF